jgi:hypothetical protein
MSYPKSQTEAIGRLRVESVSFETNLWAYRSIGGEKRFTGGKADEIQLENTYYSAYEGTPIATVARQEKECRGVFSCELKHSALGIRVQLQLPRATGPHPRVAPPRRRHQ